jgi:hypothetical protein
MVFTRKIGYLTLFFFIFLFSIFINTLNINVLINNPDRYTGDLVHNSTIRSVDNPWYTTQIKNYIDGNGFTINPEDPIMSVRRTPGYPLFYGIHYVIFGEKNAHKIIPYTQSMIFALSAVAFGATVSLITNSVVVGYILTLLYGTSLFFVGFLFHTITEGIHPSFIVFSLYYAARYFYGKRKFSYKYIILATFFCAIATLIRPINGILFIALIFSILANGKLYFEKRIKSTLLSILFFALIFSPWVAHNYNKIDEFVLLEKYNQSGAFGGFGAKQESLAKWIRSWGGPEPSHGTGLHLSISNDLNTNDKLYTIENFIEKSVPKYAYVGYSKSELFAALVAYQDCINVRIKKYSSRTSQSDLNSAREIWGPGTKPIDLMKTKWGEPPLKCELKVASIFDNFREKIKVGDPLRYYIVSPILVRGSQYIFHSNTYSMSFLNPRDKIFNSAQYIVKSFFYIVNVALFILSIIYLFIKRDRHEKLFFGSFFVISFIFLIYFIHVETRYMLGVYPSMYIMATITLMSFLKYLKSKKINKYHVKQ